MLNLLASCSVGRFMGFAVSHSMLCTRVSCGVGRFMGFPMGSGMLGVPGRLGLRSTAPLCLNSSSSGCNSQRQNTRPDP